MEIYLCHMFAFRAVEKAHLSALFGNEWVSYLFVVLMTVIGAIIVSALFKKIYTLISVKACGKRIE